MLDFTLKRRTPGPGVHFLLKEDLKEVCNPLLKDRLRGHARTLQSAICSCIAAVQCMKGGEVQWGGPDCRASPELPSSCRGQLYTRSVLQAQPTSLNSGNTPHWLHIRESHNTKQIIDTCSLRHTSVSRDAYNPGVQAKPKVHIKRRLFV